MLAVPAGVGPEGSSDKIEPSYTDGSFDMFNDAKASSNFESEELACTLL
jgi:hypothetical protein